MMDKSPAKKAWKTIRRKKGAKKAVQKVKSKQWEPGKIKYLLKLRKESKPNTCVVCGDGRSIVLQNHHVDRKRKIIVKLCANCHDVVRRGTLEDLEKAHRANRRM